MCLERSIVGPSPYISSYRGGKAGYQKNGSILHFQDVHTCTNLSGTFHISRPITPDAHQSVVVPSHGQKTVISPNAAKTARPQVLELSIGLEFQFGSRLPMYDRIPFRVCCLQEHYGIRVRVLDWRQERSFSRPMECRFSRIGQQNDTSISALSRCGPDS